MSGSGDIGYGKPPESGKFKKGKSGNPNGRPKGAKSLKTALRQELGSKLVVTEQGKVRKVSKLEALAKRLVTDALNGNPKALTELLRQVNLHLTDEAQSDPATISASAEDTALLMKFAARIAAEKEDGK